MSTRTYGILASVIGSAVGAWWWTRHRTAAQPSGSQHVLVIYDNTPTATIDLSEGII